MIFKTGKFIGKSAAYVLLRHADHAYFIMSKYPEGAPGKEFKRLAKAFDAKPFTDKCTRCSNTATRASAYAGTPSLYFWCDGCDPYSMGAVPGKLREVRSFTDAIRYAASTRTEERDVIVVLAAAKGCPKRLTAAQTFLS